MTSASLDSSSSINISKWEHYYFSEAGKHPHKITPGASSVEISISWQGVNIPWPPKRIAWVRRPENRSSWLSRETREGLEWRMKKEARRGRDRSFSGSAIVLGRSESRGSAADQPRVPAHPESLNHPILISRTVALIRHTPSARNASVYLAIFLARWWIKHEDEFVVFVIWRLLTTCWSTVENIMYN